MKENKEVTEVLNDLIRINLDRIAGYEKAIEDIGESDAKLQILFNQLADESEKIEEELGQAVIAQGGEPAEDSTVSGKVYRVWMGLKDTFSTDDAKSSLEACEFGEDAAQKAYAKAIEESREFPKIIRTMIQDQKDILKRSHDLVRNKRDEYKETEHKTHY